MLEVDHDLVGLKLDRLGSISAIFGNVILPQVLSLIEEKIQDYIYMHIWV